MQRLGAGIVGVPRIAAASEGEQCRKTDQGGAPALRPCSLTSTTSSQTGIAADHTPQSVVRLRSRAGSRLRH